MPRTMLKIALFFREKKKQERNEFKVHINLGKALISRGHREEAISEFHEAINLKPKAPDVLNDIARFLARNFPSYQAT